MVRAGAWIGPQLHRGSGGPIRTRAGTGFAVSVSTPGRPTFSVWRGWPCPWPGAVSARRGGHDGPKAARLARQNATCGRGRARQLRPAPPGPRFGSRDRTRAPAAMSAMMPAVIPAVMPAAAGRSAGSGDPGGGCAAGRARRRGQPPRCVTAPPGRRDVAADRPAWAGRGRGRCACRPRHLWMRRSAGVAAPQPRRPSRQKAAGNAKSSTRALRKACSLNRNQRLVFSRLAR